MTWMAVHMYMHGIQAHGVCRSLAAVSYVEKEMYSCSSRLGLIRWVTATLEMAETVSNEADID
jgi:hypothetical protein